MVEEIAKSKKSETMKEVYNWIKKTALQIFGGLVMDKKDDTWIVSMTKVATWAVLGHCMFIWNKVMEVGETAVQAIAQRDVSQGELYTLWTLLGVGVAKLGAKTITDTVGAIKNGGSSQS